MKYAIVSDLHANLDALERVLDDAARCGAEQVVCLGDIVGYGPLPSETLKRIREAASVFVAGNHDDAVSGRIDAADFIDLAGDAVTRHREALSRDDLAWLKSLPHTSAVGKAVLAHGDLTAPAEFRYVDTEDAAAANFAATDAPLAFVGHTHVPGIFLTGQSGRVYALGAEDFVLEDGKRYIVNVGSVGYPRESGGQCLSSYVLYDSAEDTVRFRQLPFSVASVLQRGRSTRRRRLVFGLAGGVLAIAGAIAVGIATRAADALPEPVMERTLTLDATARSVRANMKLADDSPNAVLTISYVDASGKELEPVVFTGKSSAKRFRIPKGATRAVLTIRPAAESAMPRVREFSPAAE